MTRGMGSKHQFPYLLLLLLLFLPRNYSNSLSNDTALLPEGEPAPPIATFTISLDGETSQRTYNREFDLVHQANSWIDHLRADGKQVDLDGACTTIASTITPSLRDPARDICNLAVLTRAMALELARVRWLDVWTEQGVFESVCSKQTVPKAVVQGTSGIMCKQCMRFRDILSDPNNLRIPRHPLAGTVGTVRVRMTNEENNVDEGEEQVYTVMHNGLKVLIGSEFGYYGATGAGRLDDILVLNRGVHEPQEEWIFGVVLSHLATQHINTGQGNILPMVELGSYWAFYSLWYKLHFPNAPVYLVEPDLQRMRAGQQNFRMNGITNFTLGKATFINSKVGPPNGFDLMEFYEQHGINGEIGILHADIQGAELHLLQAASPLLAAKKIRYLVISTHSATLHAAVVEHVKMFGYGVVAGADFACETYAMDGVVVAAPIGDYFFGPLELYSRAKGDSTFNHLRRELREYAEKFEAGVWEQSRGT